MKKEKILMLVWFLALFICCHFINATGTCQINQPIGSACFENTRILSSCEYVDIYFNNTFYDQAILTFNHGFYYYDYSLNIQEPGSYVLRFCDGRTYSMINMFYSNETTSDIANITILYPLQDAVINTPDPIFLYNVTPNDAINESDFLYSQVLIFHRGLSYANFTNNESMNGSIYAYDIANGDYQYYIMLFYNGGNITSEMQTFETSYTTDEMAFTTFNTLGFEDAVLCGILILVYLGVLGIGLYFANPAFQILAMLIGIGLGIFLIKVNILLGIVFILCNIGGTIIMTIGKS